MRPTVVFVNQYYHPDVAATGQQLADLSEYLVDQGFEVEVICGQTGYLKEARNAPRNELRRAVRIRRVGMTSFGRRHHLGRLIDYAIFVLQAFRRLIFVPGNSVIVFLTTPPLLATLGVALRTLRNLPFAIWSMDLHPDAEEALGMVRTDSIVAGGLHALNNLGYSRADVVVVLGERMGQRVLSKGVPAERLRTIPVWGSREELSPVAQDENPLVGQLGLEGRFVVMYSGNAGLAHQFEEVVTAARLLRSEQSIQFVFVGGGPRKVEILEFVHRHGMKNVRYLDYFPRHQLKYSLSLGDVHLLTLRSAFSGIAVPAKLYGIMGVGRPVLMVGPADSDPAMTIRRGGFGYVLEPGSDLAGDQLADRILRLKEDAGLRKRLGNRALEVFRERHERDVCCRQWADLLDDWTAGGPSWTKPGEEA